MINGVIFPNQQPLAEAHRAAFAAVLTDGIVCGCDISYNGASMTIGAGYMMVCGGEFQISGTESPAISGTNGHYARVKAVIDTTRASTTSDFAQVYFAVDTASTLTGFASLVQNNINLNGTKYEAEIAVVKIGTSGIVRKANARAKFAFGETLPTDAAEGEIFFLKV